MTGVAINDVTNATKKLAKTKLSMNSLSGTDTGRSTLHTWFSLITIDPKRRSGGYTGAVLLTEIVISANSRPVLPLFGRNLVRSNEDFVVFGSGNHLTNKPKKTHKPFTKKILRLNMFLITGNWRDTCQYLLSERDNLVPSRIKLRRREA